MSERDAPNLVKFFDGNVLIRSPAGTYVDNFAGFELDAGRAVPQLPPGAIGRVYIPGEKHSVTDGVKAVPRRLPWPPGDTILTNVPTLLQNQAARIAGQPGGPTPLNALRLMALDALFDERAAQPNVPSPIREYIDERDK